MGRPQKVDRKMLHEYLWGKADRVGRLKFNTTRFAVELGVHRVSLSRIMGELVADGAIVKLGEGQARVVLYKINPPAPPET